MAPSEFWKLTYAELCIFLEGCTARQARELDTARRLNAWLASVVIAPHVKESVTPAMLLGEKVRAPRKMKTREQEIREAVGTAFRHYRK